MKVELISWTKEPIETIARAAAMCYDSKPSEKVVIKCVEAGHDSVLECCNFTFRIIDVSRSLLTQLTRHRIGVSPTVQSQRYVRLDNPTYVIPDTIKTGDAYDVFTESMDRAWTDYRLLIEMGLKPEDARYVLPNACTTNLCLTVNLRALAHLANERLCMRASKEIRDLVKEMCRLVYECGDISETFANFMKNRMFVPRCEKGKIAYCPEHKSCGRHKTADEINKILLEYNK